MQMNMDIALILTNDNNWFLNLNKYQEILIQISQMKVLIFTRKSKFSHEGINHIYKASSTFILTSSNSLALLSSDSINFASALMYVCAISSVSILDIFCSVLRLGTTSRNLSKASLSPFIRFLSLALAASLLCLSTEGVGGWRFFLRPPLPFLLDCCCGGELAGTENCWCCCWYSPWGEWDSTLMWGEWDSKDSGEES